MSIASIAPFAPASGPRHRARRLRSRGVAIAATLGVIGAVVIAPASAEASSTPSSVEVIAASLKADTIVSDITTGKISVDQLVDADLAAWAGGGSTAPSRDQVTKEMAAEVQSVKDSGDLPATPDLDVTASEDGRVSVSASTLDSSLFSFKHLVKHWVTIKLAGNIAKLLVGAEYASAAAFLCATPGVGTLMCGFAYAIIGVLVGIYSYYPPCIGKTIFLKIPDVQHTHC